MEEKLCVLRYGSTNTFFLRGKEGGLLVDTGYAGTLRAFFGALKGAGIRLREIRYVLATHYHPDHAGLIGELTALGPRLVLMESQKGHTAFAEKIFQRDGLPFVPIDEAAAVALSFGESRAFLAEMGIDGEIVPTPSHSPDSVSVLLDGGEALVGDLEPIEYLAGYGDNAPLSRDWERILAFRPKRILYAHANEGRLRLETDRPQGKEGPQ